MLPVTPFPPDEPGAWGSPFSKVITIFVAAYGPGGYVIPKGCWLVRCEENEVDLFFGDEGMPITPVPPVLPPYVDPRHTPHPFSRISPYAPRLDPAVSRVDPTVARAVARAERAAALAGARTGARDPRIFVPPDDGEITLPDGNVLEKIIIIEKYKTGYCFADGQNVRINGFGEAKIMRVFSV